MSNTWLNAIFVPFIIKAIYESQLRSLRSYNTKLIMLLCIYLANRKTSQIPNMKRFVVAIHLAFVLGQVVATPAERPDITWVSPAAWGPTSGEFTPRDPQQKNVKRQHWSLRWLKKSHLQYGNLQQTNDHKKWNRMYIMKAEFLIFHLKTFICLRRQLSFS